MKKTGRVYIIGAGPGDPDLISIKALRALKESTVIIYDHLVSEDIVSLWQDADREGCAPAGEGYNAGGQVKLIYAGKEGGDHTLSQEEINERLIAEAAKGHVVARLKGGDPFIFGRGGEEAEVLAQAGIPFEIIPGITSAIAVPAYAGIPLTHRGVASTVAFVTGHEDPTKGKSDIDWSSLAGIGTLVFLMGVKNLPQIVSALLAAGKDRATPAALIRWGTTSRQETLVGTLDDIVHKAKDRDFRPPAIFVVGKVVALRDKLNWFENKPLFGKGVVITRPQAQSAELAARLQAEGARAILFPAIEIIPPETYQELDLALEKLDSYHWIIFTSANGVRFFMKRLREKGGDVRQLKGIRICTIGPATASAVEALGIKVDLVPDSFLSEGIIEAFQDIPVEGLRFLLPRAEIAREVIPQELAKRGALVESVVVYRTKGTDLERENIARAMAEGEVDVITFTSPSTVKGFMDIWGRENALPKEVAVACLGPVTAAAARKHGLRIDIRQEVFIVSGLVQGIKEYFSKS